VKIEVVNGVIVVDLTCPYVAQYQYQFSSIIQSIFVEVVNRGVVGVVL
jgi:hypothetical protein